ncbi:MAG: peptide ABC transporter substrate-binding protein [Bdellovibrionales bacterium]|nr:peptide ABC transporter substrate-binding protein [Bdellovibrionales bacterium]
MKIFHLITIILASLAIVSCSKKKKGDYNLDPKETLRVNITTEPPSLDWNKSTDTTSAQIQDNIMEGLVEYDFSDPDLGLVGAIAKKWSAENDATDWTFELKKNVKWTDGIELTAQHFIDGWQRLLNPLTASEYAYFLYGIKGAREYNQGKIKDFAKVEAKAVDKYTIKVKLVGPQSYFPYLLTHHCTYPIRKEIIEKFGDNWTDPKNIVTNGPFKLKTWDHDKAIVLERNEIYYGEKPKIKNVLAYMIPEMSTAINLFDKGQIDAQLTLPSTELSVLKKREEHLESGILSLYYYGFNVKKKPMDNPLVRKAISLAINRNEVTKMLAGGQIPLTSWVPPGMFGYEAEIGTGFDIEKANKLLDEAGFKDRSKLQTITLGFNTNENHQRIAENVQAQLKKNLGINVELKNEEWKVYLNTLKVDPPHVFRMGWLADYPDPDNFLNLMTSYSDNNHTNWGNKDYDSLIEDAAKELDKGKRKDIYSKAQKILTELDVPVAPVFSSVVHSLVAKRVINFPNNSMNRYQYKRVELK